MEPPGRVILIVDDDPELRLALTDALEGEGYAVATAANGVEALRVLRTRRGEVGVVLLDLMMPTMNGWQFRREQLGDPDLSAIPVLVLSAGNHIADTAASIGAVGYIKKPIAFGALVDAVERAWRMAEGG